MSFEKIFKAFERAFKDYEMQLNAAQLRVMLKRRGFVPELSFAAFEGEDIVAFTLNGIGDFNGLRTAYDTGTGTVAAFRGRGLATQIFEYSIPFLKKAGIQQYLLEVLQHNTRAVSVYKKLGFEVSREFHYFMQNQEAITFPPETEEAKYVIRPVEAERCRSVTGFRDFHPSWQNSFDAIERKPEDFKILGAFEGERFVGYCILEPNSGDITQLAVDKTHRRKGVATRLFREALKLNEFETVKIINSDANVEGIAAFLKCFNVHIKGKQFEMIRKL
jgi:ribosomal protein S18 acetylase RimI-like enzyme